MKRFILALLTLSLLLPLTSCGINLDLSELLESADLTVDDGKYDINHVITHFGQTDPIYGKLDDATKKGIIDSANAKGIVVIFDTDGTMTVIQEDGSKLIQKGSDGTWSTVDKDGTVGQFKGEWPDNEFTRLLPKPEFELTGAATDAESFSVVFVGAGIDNIRAYTEQVKKAGFTVDAETEDKEFLGIPLYSYKAKNADGYKIEIYTASGLSGLEVKKP